MSEKSTSFIGKDFQDLPKTWSLKPLEHLVNKLGSGITPRGGNEVYLSEGIPLIRSQNVLVGKLYLDNVAHISIEQHDEMGNTKLQPGDVLLNITGASIGRSCVVPEFLKEGNVNQHVCIIRPTSDLDSNFLSTILNADIGQKMIYQFLSIGNREGLNFSQIRSFLIPLPPLPHQRKIARILSTVDGLIGKTEAAIAKYQAIKQGMMHDLFTRGIGADGRLRPSHAEAPGLYRETAVGWVPREWEVVRMETHTVSSAFGPRFPATAYDEKGNIATLRTTDMDLFGNVNYKSMPLARLNENLFKEHILEEGDLLISRSGTIGVTTIFKKFDLPVLPAAFLIRFRLSSGLSPIYLKNYFTWEIGKKRLVDLAEGGVQKNLRGSSVLKMFVQVPTREEQDKIVKILGQIEKKITVENESLHKLHTLKQGLMQDLLTGRVAVLVD